MQTQEPFHQTLHATALTFNGKGVLIRGASGSGKSRLALNVMTLGHMLRVPVLLISDDRVRVFVEDGVLMAEGFQETAGLIERRFVGLCKVDFIARARLDLVVDLVSPDAATRLPEPEQQTTTLLGIPLLRLVLPTTMSTFDMAQDVAWKIK